MIVPNKTPNPRNHVRDVESEVYCPWCFKGKLKFRVFPQSVRRICLVRCGFEATISKAWLTPEEKELCYPPKV